ncbi:phosphotransferase family protein [Cognatiyoonia sp. IB215182]|uniref:phosphotransferase family protein n=1 Tax=Cognatiyoonia sp. IB215182 TaxID=3097353 RepID=UPI002A0FED36|nr:phosphotransferase [Cognatiyoonia sp. IB215182]MDX8355653.1 phosphotransferase [Cognatiyoonia sp. IB215182]
MPFKMESCRVSLSDEDIVLCTREPDLPGLAAVLDAPALAHRADLPSMRHAYLRFKSATSCVAGLIAEDGKTAWSAMTYPAERYADVRARRHWVKKAIYLDDIQTVLVPLTLERRLRPVRAMTRPAMRAHLLTRLGLEDCKLRILRYKPGRRIVLRADSQEAQRAVIKLHADSWAFEAAIAGAQQGAFSGQQALVGASSSDQAMAVRWITGQTLSPTAGPCCFVWAGQALAATHAAPVCASLADWTPQDPMGTALSVGLLVPELELHAKRLAAELPPLAANGSTPLHGDFSPDQVLIGLSGARIVDWDRAALGNPARDLGSFLAALDLAEIRGTPTETPGEALLTGYEAAGGIVEETTVQAYRAHALFALAQDGFRARRLHWAQETREVLEKTRALLRASRRQIVPGLSRALDQRVMRPRLEAITGQMLLDVAPELDRLKPGRRALVRYSSSDGQAVLGKLRAKGTDRHAPTVQIGLRSAGLDGRNGVGVPEVVGTLGDPGLWLQAEVPGAPLGALLERPNAARVMRRVGKALATLHSAPPQTMRHWTMASELNVLRRAVSDSPYSDLADLAESALDTLPQAIECGLHRDFYFDQVIVDSTTVWLVDLDLHAIGDPAIDVGNFIAHLIELGLRKADDAAFFERSGYAFLDGYAGVRSLPASERIDTLTWISLARHVTISSRFPDRCHAIPAIAALCRTRLSRQRSTTRFAM